MNTKPSTLALVHLAAVCLAAAELQINTCVEIDTRNGSLVVTLFTGAEPSEDFGVDSRVVILASGSYQGTGELGVRVCDRVGETIDLISLKKSLAPRRGVCHYLLTMTNAATRPTRSVFASRPPP